MARVKIAGTTGASENTIVYSKAGGHSHNGRNSSLIDSTAYSMYDFSPTFVGTEVNPDRAVRQENNRIAFEDVIKRVVNNSVLAPAGIRLEPGSLNGSLIIANTITANQLAANTITASEISAGTITANELSSNIVLINNRITSQNWNGTIQANGTIFSNGIGSAGWAITNTHAVFDSTLIRGSIAANSLLTPNLTISNTGAITSTNFNVTAGGNITATNANITGNIVANSVSTGGVSISNTGAISSANFNVTAAGNITATNANIAGAITATTITATTSGRIGPFDLTANSLRSTSYNAQNYMEILDYGDMYIYSAPLSGAHAGMRHTTAMIGETIVIGRNDMATNRYCIMGSDAAWGAGNVGFGIVENNSSVFQILHTGNMSFSGTLNGYSFTSGRHNGANQMVHTDGNGYLQVGYINSSNGDEYINSNPDRVWGSYGGGDSYLRTFRTSALRVSYAATAGNADKLDNISSGSFLLKSGGTMTGQLVGTSIDLSGILDVDDQVFISAAPGTNTTPALRVNRIYDSNGGYFVEFTNTAGSVRAGYIRYVIGANNQVFYATTSDGRLKELVDVEHSMLDKINQLNPTYYKWKNSDPNILFYGFIAQELHPIFPEVASEGDHDEPYVMENGNINVTDAWGVDYSKLVPPLVKAIQELSAKVDSLESRIQTLEGV